MLLAHRQHPLDEDDTAIARTASQRLARFATEQRPLSLRVCEAGQEELIELPAGAVTLLLEILDSMAAGRGVTVIPDNAELTTAAAAEVLNVSRPFLIKLLEEGAIPYRKVGKHRRVRLDDLLAYRARDDRAREAILDQLVREAQDQDLGYRAL